MLLDSTVSQGLTETYRAKSKQGLISFGLTLSIESKFSYRHGQGMNWGVVIARMVGGTNTKSMALGPHFSQFCKSAINKGCYSAQKRDIFSVQKM